MPSNATTWKHYDKNIDHHDSTETWSNYDKKNEVLNGETKKLDPVVPNRVGF